ncbi:beta-phosphoglucomutase [Brevibacillus ginsengisoli]|uniref:beta-phosphoglucomutase n=1 Tax=Brevibacillus ginsengisoli TaxID=363854 RepID=UPI003CF16649
MMKKDKKYSAALFDLDGVIVDTAKYHYLSWKKLAEELGIHFTQVENERLKGVSRMESLKILLQLGRLNLDASSKTALAEKKNRWYVESIEQMNSSEILPGVREYLVKLKERGVKIALCSASKNAPLILKRMQLEDLFEAVIDGNKVLHAKPDPEVFMLGAKSLGVAHEKCVVFEDSQAGIDAAKALGMFVVGIGQKESLVKADVVVEGVSHLDMDKLFPPTS